MLYCRIIRFSPCCVKSGTVTLLRISATAPMSTQIVRTLSEMHLSHGRQWSWIITETCCVWIPGRRPVLVRRRCSHSHRRRSPCHQTQLHTRSLLACPVFNGIALLVAEISQSAGSECSFRICLCSCMRSKVLHDVHRRHLRQRTVLGSEGVCWRNLRESYVWVALHESSIHSCLPVQGLRFGL